MTQVTHEYKCPMHGRFDFAVKIGEAPPASLLCPMLVDGGPDHDLCHLDSPWQPPTVSVIWGAGFTKT